MLANLQAQLVFMSANLQAQLVLSGTACFYADWDDLDEDDATDSETFWNFGTSSQYPVLNIDFNANGGTADDVTRQRTP